MDSHDRLLTDFPKPPAMAIPKAKPERPGPYYVGVQTTLTLSPFAFGNRQSRWDGVGPAPLFDDAVLPQAVDVPASVCGVDVEERPDTAGVGQPLLQADTYTGAEAEARGQAISGGSLSTGGGGSRRVRVKGHGSSGAGASGLTSMIVSSAPLVSPHAHVRATPQRMAIFDGKPLRRTGRVSLHGRQQQRSAVNREGIAHAWEDPVARRTVPMHAGLWTSAQSSVIADTLRFQD